MANSESTKAAVLALAVLSDVRRDPDSDISVLARQLLRLREACASVEEWWLREGMNNFAGAPACIFQVRAVCGSASAMGSKRDSGETAERVRSEGREPGPAKQDAPECPDDRPKEPL